MSGPEDPRGESPEFDEHAAEGQPRPERWSIAEMLGLVVWCAVWFAALRGTTGLWLLVGLVAFAWATALALRIRAGAWRRVRYQVASLVFGLPVSAFCCAGGGWAAPPPVETFVVLLVGVALTLSLGTSLLSAPDWRGFPSQLASEFRAFFHSLVELPPDLRDEPRRGSGVEKSESDDPADRNERKG